MFRGFALLLSEEVAWSHRWRIDSAA